jgi:site-specific recombinase XerD
VGRGEVTHSNCAGILTQVGTLFGTWVLDSLTGISGPVPVGHISTQRRNGRVVGYSVYLGAEGDLRRQRRFFRDRPDAERFLDQRKKTPLPVGELWDRKTEILYNLERLRPLGTSLTDVVSFYLENQGSVLGHKLLSEVVDEFLREKLMVGRSKQYDRVMKRCFRQFIDHVGKDQRVGDITRKGITDYVYNTNKHLSPISKKNVLTNLSVLFNFMVRRDLLEVNPVEKIDRPIVPFQKPHVLTPSDFEKLLRTCYKKGWNDRLTIFVLVGFCGIRTEEGSRLKWSNLQLDRNIVEVPATVAKKASFRNNRIPANAMEWLKLVEDKRRTGSIIGSTWASQLKSAIASSRIEYRQNCIRHSFCSYAIAAGWSLVDVISYMGHSGSPSMIHSHYRNVVSEEDGKRWFSIFP